MDNHVTWTIECIDMTHDKENIPGTNVWIKWDWDGKYELVSESKFVCPICVRPCARDQTDFWRY